MAMVAHAWREEKLHRPQKMPSELHPTHLEAIAAGILTLTPSAIRSGRKVGTLKPMIDRFL